MTKGKKAKAASKAKTKPGEGSGGGINPVVITVLLDESGSMSDCWEPTINGFNEYVNKLRRDELMANAYFSAVKFDTAGVRKLQVGAKIKDAIELTKQNYTPNGGTPLLDAIGKTIQATEEIVTEQKTDRVILVIQSDGAENSSTEFTKSQIKVMVEERTAKGWLFVFLGADINAFAEAAGMGFQAGSTMSYGKAARHTMATFDNLAASNARYMASANACQGVGMASFSTGERDASGEQNVLSKFVKAGDAAVKTTDSYSLKKE